MKEQLPLLEIIELTKTFIRPGQTELTAVDKVSFNLYPGETLGLVGESGSGKSTIAKAIVRLIDLTGGQIFLNRKEISLLKGRELRDVYRDIQMVFQSPINSFDPRRTLGDGIGESLRNWGLPRKETRSQVETLLNQCELPADFAARYPYEVSGGQCQRAAIARAIAIRPKILILDEATSALDVTAQAQIITLLKMLQKKHDMAYLFICHSLALVQLFCDRVLVMNDGKIVEEGLTNDVISHPKCEYTKRMIESALSAEFNNCLTKI